MVYVAPAGPVWLARAPVSAIAVAPVLRQVGAMITVSFGSKTPLPPASTVSASAAAACCGTVLQALADVIVTSSIHTPVAATELSEAKRKRMVTLRLAKSPMSTRTSWKAACVPDHARRPARGLWKAVLIVAL